MIAFVFVAVWGPECGSVTILRGGGTERRRHSFVAYDECRRALAEAREANERIRRELELEDWE